MTALSPSSQQRRTVQESTTSLAPSAVVAAAKKFFASRNGIYAAFPEQEGPGYLTLRGQGGEEIVIGTTQHDGATRVTASTYLFDQQVARFLTSLPTPVSRATSGEVTAAPVSTA